MLCFQDFKGIEIVQYLSEKMRTEDLQKGLCVSLRRNKEGGL